MRIEICSELHEIMIFVGLIENRKIQDIRAVLDNIKGVDYVVYGRGYFNVVPRARVKLAGLAKRVRKALDS